MAKAPKGAATTAAEKRIAFWVVVDASEGIIPGRAYHRSSDCAYIRRAKARGRVHRVMAHDPGLHQNLQHHPHGRKQPVVLTPCVRCGE